MKTELKNMHRIKSYGQNKIGCEIMAISFVFWPIFRTKMALPEAALPMGSQSSSLYFWNQWNQENGGSLHANWKSNFYFFCPPLMCINKVITIVGNSIFSRIVWKIKVACDAPILKLWIWFFLHSTRNVIVYLIQWGKIKFSIFFVFWATLPVHDTKPTVCH